jgi:hypothetical protein
MSETGTLRYAPGVAWVNDVVIAIRGGQPDKYAAAKAYLVSRHYHEGDSIIVEGDTDASDDPPVVYMEDVHREAALTVARAPTTRRRKTASPCATRKKSASAKPAPKKAMNGNASATKARRAVTTKARVPGSKAPDRITHR